MGGIDPNQRPHPMHVLCNMTRCPFCKATCWVYKHSDPKRYKCPSCGEFRMLDLGNITSAQYRGQLPDQGDVYNIHCPHCNPPLPIRLREFPKVNADWTQLVTCSYNHVFVPWVGVGHVYYGTCHNCKRSFWYGIEGRVLMPMGCSLHNQDGVYLIKRYGDKMEVVKRK